MLVSYAVDGLRPGSLGLPTQPQRVVDGAGGPVADGLRRAAADPAVRAVVLGHTGNTFCAGAGPDRAVGRVQRRPVRCRGRRAAG